VHQNYTLINPSRRLFDPRELQFLTFYVNNVASPAEAAGDGYYFLELEMYNFEQALYWGMYTEVPTVGLSN